MNNEKDLNQFLTLQHQQLREEMARQRNQIVIINHQLLANMQRTRVYRKRFVRFADDLDLRCIEVLRCLGENVTEKRNPTMDHHVKIQTAQTAVRDNRMNDSNKENINPQSFSYAAEHLSKAKSNDNQSKQSDTVRSVLLKERVVGSKQNVNTSETNKNQKPFDKFIYANSRRREESTETDDSESIRSDIHSNSRDWAPLISSTQIEHKISPEVKTYRPLSHTKKSIVLQNCYVKLKRLNDLPQRDDKDEKSNNNKKRREKRKSLTLSQKIADYKRPRRKAAPVNLSELGRSMRLR